MSIMPKLSGIKIISELPKYSSRLPSFGEPSTCVSPVYVIKDDALVGELEGCYELQGYFEEGEIIHGSNELSGRSFYVMGERGKKQYAIRINWRDEKYAKACDL
jgi:hypothetical protein